MDDVRPSGSSPAPSVLCREIAPADFGELLLLLRKGFPERPRAHYVRALERLGAHNTPPGFPKYGYVLEVSGVIVGVILTIFSSTMVNGENRLRINVSSHYVDPEFRLYAAIMTSRLRSYKQATHLNVTPAPHTWPMLQALGYHRICNGGFFALAAVSGPVVAARVRRVSSAVEPGDGLSQAEAQLLRDHASYGCISVVCEWEHRRYPFVFVPSRIPWKGIRLPYAMLAYCRDFESYVQLARPLGRYLLLRGMPLIFSDANGPVPGLKGRYVDWGVKFARGPHMPHLGDLSYTELAMFELPSPRRTGEEEAR